MHIHVHVRVYSCILCVLVIILCFSLSKSKKGFLDAYQVALEEFRLSDLYGDSDGPHHYATFAYDAVWTMALALDRTEADLLSVLILSLSRVTFRRGQGGIGPP